MDKFYRLALDKIAHTKENNFRHLDLSYMNLVALPKEMFELKNLISLDLRGNILTSLPDEFNDLENLWQLDISETQLDFHAVSSIKKIVSIAYFRYDETPFQDDLPLELRHRSISEILEFYSYLEDEQRTQLLEAKLILVGYGEVGKTTLMKKMLDPKHKVRVGTEPTTHGINIKKWKLHCALIPLSRNELIETVDHLKVSDSKVDVNVWDFGGQEIYYATHQFFLTKRSVYLFVWEARKEEEYSQFDYWLNIIKHLSESSPVIVVMNKSDIRDKNIDEYTLRKKFPNIKAFLKVSCKKGTGFKDLQNKVRGAIGSLEHISDIMPQTWKEVRKFIERYKKDYISSKEYYEICDHFHIRKKQADSLSEYFHDLGVILHFSHDSILRNTVILNPEWATKAVYTLLDNKTIIDSNGKFSFVQLQEIWNLRRYPVDKHIELLRLMEKFELIFNLTGTTDYIIPELLESKQPRYTYSRFDTSKLRIEYRYEFMPAGIMSRLICRLHHLVQDDYYWKDGVLLEYENSNTFIKSETINKKLIVRINGEDASQTLSIIRHELSVIHRSLNLEKDKDFFEMVPCNCIECMKSLNPEFYSYNNLKKFILKGRETTICNKSAEDVAINCLLNGYEVTAKENDLIYHILNACSKLQGHHSIIDSKEDSRNEYIATIINSRIFSIKDQTRWGKSESGKNEGELDIRLDDRNDLPLSIFEAFTLNRFDKIKIKRHLEKISNYDPNGLKENYIVVYNESSNFKRLWQKYLELLPEINFKYPMKDEPKDVSDRYAYGTEIVIAQTNHIRSKERVKLYHIFLNLNFD